MKLLRTRDVAERLNVSLITVKRLLGSGRLPGVKIGRVWRIPEEGLRAFLRGRLPEGPSNEDRTWQEAALARWVETAPYDWEDVDPESIGEPLCHVPGKGWVSGG